MKMRLIGGAAAVGGLLAAAAARGQAPVPVPVAPVPVVPVAPVPAAAVPAAPVAAVPAAPARNIWSFFMLTPEQRAAKAAKKDRFCRSPLGQLLHSMMRPAGAISGGIVGGCCPPDTVNPLAPSPEDLAKPPTDAEGAAARIKKLELESAERRAAVRYLGTVDCRRFPEAEAALINALRTDTNECVRFEAALALARGCCCTRKTVEALTLTVNGGTADNNPPETSPRVRAMAAQALALCCSRADLIPAPPEPPVEPPPPERPGAAPAATVPADYMTAARKALEEYAAAQAVRPQLVTGQRSLAGAFRAAVPAGGEVTSVIVRDPPPQPMPPAAPEVVPAVVPAAAPQPRLAPAVPQPAPPPAAVPVPPTGQRNLLQILKTSLGRRTAPAGELE